MDKAKRITIAILSGLIILVVTWKYQNNDYTLALEDAFFKKVFLVRDKVFRPAPKKNAEIVFVNTGKDLALVEDSIDYGNVTVSDREKIYRVLKYINESSVKPALCVIDIQFYYPYTVKPEIDSAMQAELSKSDIFIIPILKGSNGKYKSPLYEGNYAYSGYRTFSSTFNKFRIMMQEDVKSIPIVMHEMKDGARYEDHFLFPRCDGRLCLTSLWPKYYLNDDTVKRVASGESITLINEATKGDRHKTEYYNIGEFLFELEGNPGAYSFGNKVVIIGNFLEDVHVTPVGKMAGPVLLANIYLSLLNGEHFMSPWLILLMLISFSILSYIAIFKKMPEINIPFKFLFSSYLSKFIKGYISYFGAMFFISLLALILFDVQVALFLPSVIFTCIEYIKEKKYLELKK